MMITRRTFVVASTVALATARATPSGAAEPVNGQRQPLPTCWNLRPDGTYEPRVFAIYDPDSGEIQELTPVSGESDSSPIQLTL